MFWLASLVVILMNLLLLLQNRRKLRSITTQIFELKSVLGESYDKLRVEDRLSEIYLYYGTNLTLTLAQKLKAIFSQRYLFEEIKNPLLHKERENAAELLLQTLERHVHYLGPIPEGAVLLAETLQQVESQIRALHQ